MRYYSFLAMICCKRHVFLDDIPLVTSSVTEVSVLTIANNTLCFRYFLNQFFDLFFLLMVHFIKVHHINILNINVDLSNYQFCFALIMILSPFVILLLIQNVLSCQIFIINSSNYNHN